MKRMYFFLSTWLVCTTLIAQAEAQWIRYPAISPDGSQIVFTYKGDLYLVSSEGGNARPLTWHKAHDYMPVWNHAGNKIAFASDRYGNFDVYIMATGGGNPLRLTYHSNAELPYAFTADDQSVVFGGQRLDAVDHRQYPTSSQPEVYRVSVTGGRVDQLWTIPAEYIAASKDGSKMLYHDKKGGENEWRKHHTSSVTRDIWMYDANQDSHSMITFFHGEDRNPVFTASEEGMYYLSEESGSFNVHKLSFGNPAQNNQVSHFDTHPVRFLSASMDGTLSYTWHGNLFIQKEGDEPERLSVIVQTENKDNDYEIVPVSGNISEMALSPDGKEVAYVVRGEIFVTALEGSITKRITNTAAQERFISFTPDGKALVYASERGNKWSIYKTVKQIANEPFFFASTLLKEEPMVDNAVDNYQPKISPDGKKIAYVEEKRSLVILDLENKTKTYLLGPDELFYMRDGDQYFEWSPDSHWLFAQYAPTMSNREILLLAADGSKTVNLTESGYSDYRPKWVNKGEQMLWFSDRHGLRSYANSGSRQGDVYAMFFTKDGWDRFNMSKDEYALWKEMQEIAKKKKDEAEKKEDKKKRKDEEAKKDSLELSIDWVGLDKRKTRLTIHSSRLADALISKDGETLYYLARFEKDYNLWSTNLRTRETKMLVPLKARSGNMIWNKEMKEIILLANGNISVIDPATKKSKPVATKSEMVLDLDAERKQMFDHVCNRVRTMFYISDYHGTDIGKLMPAYEAKLPFIGNDFEFAELLSEMLGETNVSHSGARYRGNMPNSDQTASLGIFIDYEFEGKGIKIAEIIKGGPLDKDHLEVKEGMIIEEINGTPLDASVDYAKLLNRLADHFVSLLVSDPESEKREHVTVKPISLGEEGGLLYDRWVRLNEEKVDNLSGGKLGYVHIRGMSDEPYRGAYEKMMGKYHDRKGVIVDTRFNGGGDLVSDLAMFFTGKEYITYEIESRKIGYEPAFRYTKPTVAMVNEANYSDGHCFACGYQQLGIGKLIGMPVPGTCSFASWENLQNGTVRFGSVPVSAKNGKGEWLENREAVPEVMIKNMPGKIDKGIDQQLEKAIEELLNVVVN